ncbi:hypothetical protein CCAX7_39490 [Capsulimonas corticalis]|uniref:Cell division protein SepF n=1 Tax=Capsulimonas corticalis TaxID=2219043 RepID=A0A402D3H2_9BACT|nr:cell division protein SepF [Capsulimonas corticalis]BDI31898.1 hypothetical protein CCAX7_39490 [Capsulimonas corticalis]
MSQHAEAEEFENARPRNGFMRFFDRAMGHDDYHDEDEDDAVEAPAASSAAARTGGSVSPLRRQTTLRMDQARRTHVTVRRAVQSFDDARRAADGLKEGQQQIVNLEQTPGDMAERIIDFLNGSTYALDGSVEKIGEQVYLFTPSTVTIDVEDKPAPGTRTSFLDRS